MCIRNDIDEICLSQASVDDLLDELEKADLNPEQLRRLNDIIYAQTWEVKD